MNNKQLTKKYSSILLALTIFKGYTVAIIICGILFLLIGLPNLSLFLFVLFMNCCMNYLIYTKICKYFELLNDLLINETVA